MKIARVLVVLILLAAFTTGCAHMTRQQQRILSGGAIGAGAGAVISGASGGNIAAGSAIRAAAGALGGFLYDQTKHHHRR
jgi:osmotically inducible lipoprotein OsmB